MQQVIYNAIAMNNKLRLLNNHSSALAKRDLGICLDYYIVMVFLLI